MTYHEKCIAAGNRLFRWRSYLPLALVPLALLALREAGAPAGGTQLWRLGCLGLSLVGFAIRCVTKGTVPKGTSGRNTKRLKAAALNTTGMYSVVRHPLYLGDAMALPHVNAVRGGVVQQDAVELGADDLVGVWVLAARLLEAPVPAPLVDAPHHRGAPLLEKTRGRDHLGDTELFEDRHGGGQ